MQRPADASFGVPQLIAHVGYGLPSTDRAQKFPRLTSRRIWLSMMESDKARLSRAFSCSSSFNRFA